MHTADRFQGRDKEVIILSLVRSNEAKSIGELLKDQRRINVAFTRAKTKLLVIGSRETLKGNGPKSDGTEEMVARFVGLMEEKNWIYDLPIGALENHCFEEEPTQVTASGISRPAGTQWTQVENERSSQKVQGDSDKENGGGKKRRVLGEGRENRNMQRQPAKKIRGNKPFKVPKMSVLTDILNEVLH
jgi:DNA replication ATP-dependent helicase Dna2